MPLVNFYMGTVCGMVNVSGLIREEQHIIPYFELITEMLMVNITAQCV
jgi:hypothetical protein